MSVIISVLVITTFGLSTILGILALLETTIRGILYSKGKLLRGDFYMSCFWLLFFVIISILMYEGVIKILQ